MNRFSKDIGNVDEYLSWMMLELILVKMNTYFNNIIYIIKSLY